MYIKQILQRRLLFLCMPYFVSDEYFVATTSHIITINPKGQEVNRIESHQRGFAYDPHRDLFVSIRSTDSQIVLLKPSGMRVEKVSVAGLFSGACISHVTYCCRNDAYIMTDSLRHKVHKLHILMHTPVYKYLCNDCCKCVCNERSL